MLFQTPIFVAFLLIVFILHWWLGEKSVRGQNFILIIASYVFYAAWDYRFLFLLILSTIIDFWSGIKIADANTKQSKKNWLIVSVGLNLCLLAFFKYFNFFIDSVADLTLALKLSIPISYLNILLPIGISFYTFHGLSYVIDTYKERIEPTRNFEQYALFVSFFPLLVAGPIERATHLLPQLTTFRTFHFSQAAKGLKQILYGLFKKLVIADNCAEFANEAFSHYADLPSSTLLLGIVFFSFQIYGDFSGYTDMAIGIGRLFGINLLRNFSFPYFATNIASFWKRWHISLTSWFRDYLYIPLGGSFGSKLQTLRNTFIVFMLSGFWHGANYTFLAWGLLHFLYFLPHIYLKKNLIDPNKLKKRISIDIIKIFFTFSLVSFAWIFFRSPNIGSAIEFIEALFKNSFLVNPFLAAKFKGALLVCMLLFIFIIIEWKGKEYDFALEGILIKSNRIWRLFLFSFLAFLIMMYMKVETSPFIYFQF